MLALVETRKAVPAAESVSEFLPRSRKVKNFNGDRIKIE